MWGILCRRLLIHNLKATVLFINISLFLLLDTLQYTSPIIVWKVKTRFEKTPSKTVPPFSKCRFHNGCEKTLSDLHSRHLVNFNITSSHCGILLSNDLQNSYEHFTNLYYPFSITILLITTTTGSNFVNDQK